MRKCTNRLSNKVKYDTKSDYTLIYDPCYRYSRLAKESFLKNPYCCLALCLASNFLKE